MGHAGGSPGSPAAMDLRAVPSHDIQRLCHAALAQYLMPHGAGAGFAAGGQMPLDQLVVVMEENLRRQLMREYFTLLRGWRANNERRKAVDVNLREKVYKKIAAERLELLEKAKAKIQALTIEVAEYRELVMSARKETADLRIKAQYARENVFLETLQSEERMLRQIEKEIDSKSITAADRQNYCRTCFAVIEAKAVEPIPTRRGDGGGMQQQQQQHRWDALPIVRRRDITIARIINVLREQVRWADSAVRQQQEYGDNMYASLKKLHATYLEDAKLNAQFKTAAVTAELEAEGLVLSPGNTSLTPAQSPLQEGAPADARPLSPKAATGATVVHTIAQRQKAELLRTNFVLVKTGVEEFRQSVRTQVKQMQRMMAEGAARVSELVQDHVGSAHHPRLLLQKADHFYEEFRTFTQTVEWPFHLSERLTPAFESFSPLADIPAGPRSIGVLEKLSRRYSDVFGYLQDLVAALIAEAAATAAERSDWQTKVSGLEHDLSRTQDNYDRCMDELARQRTRMKEVLDTHTVAENRWQYEMDALNDSIRAAQRELEKTEVTRKEIVTPQVFFEPERPPMVDAWTLTSEIVESEMNTTQTRIENAFAVMVDSSTNTLVTHEVGVQTIEDRRIEKSAAKVKKKDFEMQTIDFFFAHAQTQTPRAITRHKGSGVDKTVAGTMTDAGVFPAHYDGSSTTTTTFCLAQSKLLEASKAYTHVKYVCVDDLADEEPVRREVDDPVECQFIVSQLKVSLRSAFVKVDCIRQLLVAYRFLYDKLSFYGRPPSQRGRRALEPPSPNYSLPPDVRDAIDDVKDFDAEVCLMHKPEVEGVVGQPRAPHGQGHAPTAPARYADVYSEAPLVRVTRTMPPGGAHAAMPPVPPPLHPATFAGTAPVGGTPTNGDALVQRRPWRPKKAKPKDLPSHRALLRAERRAEREAGGEAGGTTPLPELAHTPLTARHCR